MTQSDESLSREPVYVISVAAELSGMHPQTLRMYERKGLVCPSRTSGNTRRYSEQDIELLREIQRLTQEEGINLAGVAQLMDLRLELLAVKCRVARLEAELDAVMRDAKRKVQEVHRSYRRDLVLYNPPAQLVPQRKHRRRPN